MINFCITNRDELVKGQWTYKKNLSHNVCLHYDSGVEIIETSTHLIAFCGILWEGKVTDFLKDVKQNGNYYAIVLDKVSGELKAITDFSNSFGLTYYAPDSNFVITNEIKVYGPSFKVNQQWINWCKKGVELTAPVEPHPNLHSSSPFCNIVRENHTPIIDVKLLKGGDTLTLESWDDFDCRPTITNWYKDYLKDITQVPERPKHNYNSALLTVKNVISENCRLVKEKYGDKLIFCGSTGVDSLTLKSYLGDTPMYGWDEGYDTSLFVNCITPTSELLDNIINQYPYKCENLHLYNFLQLMIRYMIDKNKLNNRVVVLGGYADTIFWHTRSTVMWLAVHRWGMTTGEQVWNKCLRYYGFEDPGFKLGFFNMQYKQDCIDEINKYILHEAPGNNFETEKIKEITYWLNSSFRQWLPNQLIVYPYRDLRLFGVLLSSDKQTQEASILDAQIQKDIISDKLLPYLNQYKTHMHVSYEHYNGCCLNHDHHKHRSNRKIIIDSIIKNLQAST
jgi:hypothetical protein